MIAPPVRSVIGRRILVNYRVDPDVAAAALPAPFRPALVGGHAIAGICLIKLERIRPAGLPAFAGLSTENVAHRFAVRWDSDDGPVEGVFIPRRDTDSRLTALAGGRVFPGWYQRARIEAVERAGRIAVRVASLDGRSTVAVAGRLADQVMPGSVFADAGSAARFFRRAPVGFSARKDGAGVDPVALDCADWNLVPLAVEHAKSSYFDDENLFPRGAIMLDSAFLMRGSAATWSVPRSSPGPVRPGRSPRPARHGPPRWRRAP